MNSQSQSLKTGKKNESRPGGRGEVPKGLLYARWAGLVTGLVLLVYGPLTMRSAGGEIGYFAAFRTVFFILYGLLLLFPVEKIKSERGWRAGLVTLTVFSVAFVFIMIVTVMFDYMEAAEQGERLGVPGKEGTLIFLCLLQVPVAIFLRKPDLLD